MLRRLTEIVGSSATTSKKLTMMMLGFRVTVTSVRTRIFNGTRSIVISGCLVTAYREGTSLHLEKVCINSEHGMMVVFETVLVLLVCTLALTDPMSVLSGVTCPVMLGQCIAICRLYVVVLLTVPFCFYSQSLPTICGLHVVVCRNRPNPVDPCERGHRYIRVAHERWRFHRAHVSHV